MGDPVVKSIDFVTCDSVVGPPLGGSIYNYVEVMPSGVVNYFASGFPANLGIAGKCGGEVFDWVFAGTDISSTYGAAWARRGSTDYDRNGSGHEFLWLPRGDSTAGIISVWLWDLTAATGNLIVDLSGLGLDYATDVAVRDGNPYGYIVCVGDDTAVRRFTRSETLTASTEVLNLGPDNELVYVDIDAEGYIWIAGGYAGAYGQAGRYDPSGSVVNGWSGGVEPDGSLDRFWDAIACWRTNAFVVGQPRSDYPDPAGAEVYRWWYLRNDDPDFVGEKTEVTHIITVDGIPHRAWAESTGDFINPESGISIQGDRIIARTANGLILTGLIVTSQAAIAIGSVFWTGS